MQDSLRGQDKSQLGTSFALRVHVVHLWLICGYYHVRVGVPTDVARLLLFSSWLLQRVP